MTSVLLLQQWELSEQERPDRFGPLQQHRRAVASLEKQIQQRRQQLEEVRADPGSARPRVGSVTAEVMTGHFYTFQLQVQHAEMTRDCEEAKGKLVEVGHGSCTPVPPPGRL